MVREGKAILLIQERAASENPGRAGHERGDGRWSWPAWFKPGWANHSLGSNPAGGSQAKTGFYDEHWQLI